MATLTVKGCITPRSQFALSNMILYLESGLSELEENGPLGFKGEGGMGWPHFLNLPLMFTSKLFINIIKSRK